MVQDKSHAKSYWSSHAVVAGVTVPLREELHAASGMQHVTFDILLVALTTDAEGSGQQARHSVQHADDASRRRSNGIQQQGHSGETMVHTQAISAVWREVKRGENCKGPTEEGIVKLIPGMVYVAIPGPMPSVTVPSLCLQAGSRTYY